MKTKKKGGEKPRKTPLPVVQQPAAPARHAGITPGEAAEEFRIRIAMIGQDFSHDPGMMKYRAALILAVEAIEQQYQIKGE